MSGYWANFAKTGDPSGKGLPTWTAYDSDAEAKHHLRKAQVDFLERAQQARSTATR
jgi:carboxylesterase type B